MSEPKIIMSITLDLSPPNAAEESRDVVTARCLATIEEIRICMRAGLKEPKMLMNIAAFLDNMSLFFEPALPPELKEFLQEWGSYIDPSAA